MIYLFSNFQQPEQLRYSYSLEEKKVYGTIKAVYIGGCVIEWDDGTKGNISKIHLRREGTV